MAWLDRAAVLALIGLAGLSAVFAVLHGFAYFDHARWYGLIQLGLMALGLVQLWAFSTTPRSPATGGAVVLVSGVALALMWAFLPPVAATALIVTAYGVYRAFQFGKQRRRTAA